LTKALEQELFQVFTNPTLAYHYLLLGFRSMVTFPAGVGSIQGQGAFVFKLRRSSQN